VDEPAPLQFVEQRRHGAESYGEPQALASMEPPV